MPNPKRRNRLEILLMKAAVEKDDKGVIEKIKEEIRKATGYTPNKLTFILTNQAQPSKAEATLIANIISKYILCRPEEIFEPNAAGSQPSLV